MSPDTPTPARLYMTRNGYNTLAIICILAAVTTALAGNNPADDLLATALVGLAGTIAGRGKEPA